MGSTDFPKAETNKNELNNLEFNKNNLSNNNPIQSYQQRGQPPHSSTHGLDRDRMQERNSYRELIEDNIEYDFLIDQYGKERMEAVVRREAAGPASAVVNALVADLRDFKAGLPLEDDVTLVVIKATA